MVSIRAVLLDLDGTLADTAALSILRKQRRWKDCVSRLSETTLFPGVKGTLEAIRGRSIKIGVITSSVSFYAEALMKLHDIRPDTLVAWHDTKMHKPAPDPFLHAMKKLGCGATDVLGVGDLEEDAVSLSGAGVAKAMGAGWSPSFQKSLKWHSVLASPEQIVSML